jgi:hypothetical protein
MWSCVILCLLAAVAHASTSLVHITQLLRVSFREDQITCVGAPCAWLPLCRGIGCSRPNATADFGCHVPGERPANYKRRDEPQRDDGPQRRHEQQGLRQSRDEREWVTVLLSRVECDTFRDDWPGWINVSACRLTLRLLGPAVPEPHLLHPLPLCTTPPCPSTPSLLRILLQSIAELIMLTFFAMVTGAVIFYLFIRK